MKCQNTRSILQRLNHLKLFCDNFHIARKMFCTEKNHLCSFCQYSRLISPSPSLRANPSVTSQKRTSFIKTVCFHFSELHTGYKWVSLNGYACRNQHPMFKRSSDVVQKIIIRSRDRCDYVLRHDGVRVTGKADHVFRL